MILSCRSHSPVEEVCQFKLFAASSDKKRAEIALQIQGRCWTRSRGGVSPLRPLLPFIPGHIVSVPGIGVVAALFVSAAKASQLLGVNSQEDSIGRMEAHE